MRAPRSCRRAQEQSLLTLVSMRRAAGLTSRRRHSRDRSRFGECFRKTGCNPGCGSCRKMSASLELPKTGATTKPRSMMARTLRTGIFAPLPQRTPSAATADLAAVLAISARLALAEKLFVADHRLARMRELSMGDVGVVVGHADHQPRRSRDPVTGLVQERCLGFMHRHHSAATIAASLAEMLGSASAFMIVANAKPAITTTRTISNPDIVALT